MIKTFLVIILVILLFYFIFNNIENFASVKLSNDFYIPDNINVNLNGKTINARRICIFKRNPSKEKIVDIECIDSNELLSTLNLPVSRKKLVCLDGNCLNKSDIKLLNGAEPFKLLNKSQHPLHKDKCVGGHHAVKLKRCGTDTKISWLHYFIGTWWNRTKIFSFSPVACDQGGAWDYRLIPGNNLDKNLKRDEVSSSAPAASPRIPFSEGHG